MTQPRRGETSWSWLFRRSAADVSNTFITHGSRRGLQNYRRSAAFPDRPHLSYLIAQIPRVAALSHVNPVF
jgi:hypothetical protein